jgi:hypothetical protein
LRNRTEFPRWIKSISSPRNHISSRESRHHFQKLHQPTFTQSPLRIASEKAYQIEKFEQTDDFLCFNFGKTPRESRNKYQLPFALGFMDSETRVESAGQPFSQASSGENIIIVMYALKRALRLAALNCLVPGEAFRAFNYRN